ncbi:hypothetical protein BE11_45625 [Sorangium cellulosum]|nr:hypothetical protein BE11_45625 [Sorangium cellulosum]
MSDAELKYLKAWAVVRSFDIAANLGEVQLQLKKPRSAATFLAFALRTAPPSTKARCRGRGDRGGEDRGAGVLRS